MRERTNSYRIQLSKDFTFQDTQNILDYLKELGIDVLYLSPIFAARKGSSHGYDVVDVTSICEERGGEAQFLSLSKQAHAMGFSILVDFVPNHMALSSSNPWIKDIVEKGKDSDYQSYFDIDFAAGNGKLIVPFYLGKFPYVTLGQSINYRRFFDITHLICTKMENKNVYKHYHKKLLQLIDDGYIDGIRIDHIDGLLDPKGYLDNLKADGCDWVIVEKILSEGEQIQPDWNIHGTVGYEYLTLSNQLFVNQATKQLFTSLSDMKDPESELIKAKKDYILAYLKPEMLRLGDVRLIEPLSKFPRYRTYIQNGRGSKEDMDILKGFNISPDAPYLPIFQQISATTQAKGFEDTHLYRYNRLLALNEVGGTPHTFGKSAQSFHELNQQNLHRFPDTLLPNNTHDTKRSENVRARLLALTYIEDTWERLVSTVIEHWKDSPVDSATKYFLLQTLIGMQPKDETRLTEYMQKAIREAKVNTSWISHNQKYEQEVRALCIEALEDQVLFELLSEIEPSIHEHATAIEKGLLTLRAGSPGILDTYFGGDKKINALVDPDNRRAVHFVGRHPDEDIQTVLLFRKKYSELIKRGEYIPLKSDGIAFARKLKDVIALFAASTTYITLPDTLHGKEFREVFENNQIESYPRIQTNSSGTILISL